jgi:hypothetical protein
MAYLPGIEGLRKYKSECIEYTWLFRHLARWIRDLPPGEVPRDSPQALERWVNVEIETHHRPYDEVMEILAQVLGNDTPIDYMKKSRNDAIERLNKEANFLEDRARTLENMSVLANPDSLTVPLQKQS